MLAYLAWLWLALIPAHADNFLTGHQNPIFGTDKRAAAINELNLQWLSSSQLPNRHQYILRLLGRKPNPNLIRSVRRGEISDREFLEIIFTLPETARSFDEKLLFKNPDGSSKTLEILNTFLETIRLRPYEWESAYFGSDEAFQKVRRNLPAISTVKCHHEFEEITNQ